MLSGLFGRRPRAKRGEDCVWSSRDAKLAGLVAMEGVRLVAHFPDTQRALQALARQQGRSIEVVMSQGLVEPPSPQPGLTVIVAERHPLREHDERVATWADAAASRIVFHTSLDDAVLSLFVNDTLRGLLDKLGMTADTPMEHGMVSRSIETAQARLKKKARTDFPADSAAAWLQANLEA